MTVREKNQGTTHQLQEGESKGKNQSPLFLAVSVLGGVQLATFPIWGYFTIPSNDIGITACMLIVSAFMQSLYRPGVFRALIAGISVIIGVLAALGQNIVFLKFWPIAMILLVLLFLFIGMGKDSGGVAKMVAKTSGSLGTPERAYSKGLSQVLFVLFMLLGVVSSLTCFWGNLRSWSFWNGGAVWVIIILFGLSERLARSLILKDLKRQAGEKGL